VKDSFDPAGLPSPSPLALAEMQPELLDIAGLREVFMALAMETTVRGILLRGEKGPIEKRAASEQTTLRAARDALERGDADGAQIHYVHEAVEWWDTVMRTEAGFRRVRVRKGGPGAP
jgi:hypothetical protein